MTEDSRAYYETHAADYAAATRDLELAAFYDLFLPHLPEKACILDAGCGSGRDARHFASLGHNVTALEGADRMASQAAIFFDGPVIVQDFTDMTFDQTFDGVWAAAALDSLSDDALALALMRIDQALKPGGIAFCSFRVQFGSVAIAGFPPIAREPKDLCDCLKAFRNFTVIDTTQQPGPLHPREDWLCLILRKSEEV